MVTHLCVRRSLNVTGDSGKVLNADRLGGQCLSGHCVNKPNSLGMHRSAERLHIPTKSRKD